MMFKRKKPVLAGRRQPTYNERPGAPRAFSYHARRSDENITTGRMQPREQDIRRQARLTRYWRQRFGVLLATAIIIVCAVNVLHLSADPKIVPLTSSSNNYFLHDDTAYEQAAEKMFKSSLLNSNKITVNTDQIAQQLKQKFPELSDVSITLPLIGHRPVVYLAPTTPSLVLATERGQAYILDENGKALADTSKVPDIAALHLPVVTDQSGLNVALGDIALPSDDIGFILAVDGQLQAQHYQISSLVLPPAASELDVHFADKPYYGKFNMHNVATARQQAGTFIATDADLAGKHTVPAQYIDVRVDGRAYYK